MSRQFKAYASAYQPRDHESQLTVGDVCEYACDLNGALDGETITAATWGQEWGRVGLSGLSVTDGVATVTVVGTLWGCEELNLQVTTDTGRVLSQRYRVSVRPQCAPAAGGVSWP